jgi:hypothetical protein
MKMKMNFGQTAFLALLLFSCSVNVANAQADAKKAVPAKVKYCDTALPEAEKRMKAEANNTCTTQHICVECTERTSKVTIAATMVVQPDKGNCKPVTDITCEECDAVDFTARILQSPCFAGGTNLEVIIPGYGKDSREFSYLWEIDGGKGGHLASIQCACGKIARVRVTQLATGKSMTLIAKLNSTCGGGGSTNK